MFYKKLACIVLAAAMAVTAASPALADDWDEIEITKGALLHIQSEEESEEDQSEDYEYDSEDEEDSGYDDFDEDEEDSSYDDSEEDRIKSGSYLGNFMLTAYCNCAQCCGSAGQPTASGTMPVEGRTVAMAGVDFGTKLLIDGNVYTVEDRGTSYGHVDIYMDSHEACLDFGVQYADVYLVD